VVLSGAKAEPARKLLAFLATAPDSGVE
jgi:hypothetical protein